MDKLLIGADPEFFVKKNGEFVSAHGLIEGTKKNPLKVKGGAVQVDGMALEFNVNPASTFEEFEDNMQSVLGELRAMVPKEYEFAFVPVADFSEEYIRNQPEEARMLGCEPDFNAYSGLANNPPNVAANFRTASGHFHLGWTEGEDIKNPDHIDACKMMAIQLDCTIGLASVIYDADTRRRELYGKAGAFRPKSYGVEYRVLSNFWLNNKKTREHLFNTITFSYEKLLAGVNYDRDYIGAGTSAKCINKSVLDGAYNNFAYLTKGNAHFTEAYKQRMDEITEALNAAPAPVRKRAVKKAVVADDIIAVPPAAIPVEWFRAGLNNQWVVNNFPPPPPVINNIDNEFDLGVNGIMNLAGLRARGN